jgi:hypothetical protein
MATDYFDEGAAERYDETTAELTAPRRRSVRSARRPPRPELVRAL